MLALLLGRVLGRAALRDQLRMVLNTTFRLPVADGPFKLSVKDTTKLRYSRQRRTLTALAPGTLQIEVRRGALIGYASKITVEILAISSLHIGLPLACPREFYVGDKIDIDVYAIFIDDKGGRRSYDPTRSVKVFVNDTSVLRIKWQVGHARRPGFATIYATLHGFTSETITINVFHRLTARPGFATVCGERQSLAAAGGPVPWPGLGQRSWVACGDFKKFDYDHESGLIVFKEKFEGTCTLHVQNNAPERCPIQATVNFTVKACASRKVFLTIRDLNASDENPCGYLGPTKSLVWSDREFHVPSGHSLEVDYEVICEDGSSLGRDLGGCPILLSKRDLTDAPIVWQAAKSGTLRAKLDCGDRQRIPRIKVAVVRPPRFPNSTIDVWYNDDSTAVTLIDGSSNLTTNDTLTRVVGRDVAVLPSADARFVRISDICVPEHVAVGRVVTVVPALLVIDGPVDAIWDNVLNYRVRVIDQFGRPIGSQFYRKMTMAASPEGFGAAHWRRHPTRWTLRATGPGDVLLTAALDNVTGSLQVRLHATPVCAPAVGRVSLRGRVNFSVDPICRVVAMDESADEFRTFVDDSPGFELIPLVSGNLSIGVGVECENSDHEYEAVCEVQSIEYFRVVLNKSTDSSFVGCFVLVDAKIDASCGLLQPDSVTWSVSGTRCEWKLLWDDSVVVHGLEKGTVRLNADVGVVPSASIDVYFDEELVVTPGHITLPPHANYQIDVHPEGATFASSSPQLSVKGGLVTATEPGNYLVNVSYHSQWKLVTVGVEEPGVLFLDALGGGVVRPRLVDPDGQEFSGTNGTTLTIKPPAIPGRDGDWRVTSAVVDCTVESPSFRRRHRIQLEDIAVKDATVQAGVPLAGVECVPSREVECRNGQFVGTRAETVNVGGVVVRVFEYIDVFLRRQSELEYRVEPRTFPDVDLDGAISANDLEYACDWNAAECGVAKYDAGRGVCRLELNTPRLCPVRSMLVVRVKSNSTNVSLSRAVDLVRNNPWGESIRLANATATLHVYQRAADIRVVQGIEGVNVTLDEEGGSTKVRLRQTAEYRPGCVRLLEVKSQEMMKICVRAERKAARTAGRWAETAVKAFWAALALIAGYVVFSSCLG
jgi:hypothetical protein